MYVNENIVAEETCTILNQKREKKDYHAKVWANPLKKKWIWKHIVLCKHPLFISQTCLTTSEISETIKKNLKLKSNSNHSWMMVDSSKERLHILRTLSMSSAQDSSNETNKSFFKAYRFISTLKKNKSSLEVFGCLPRANSKIENWRKK